MPETITGGVKPSRHLAAYMSVASVLTIGGVFLTTGAAFSQEEDRPQVPAYEVVDIFEAQGVVEVDVATEAKREAGMRLIAGELRENELNVPDGGTLLVEYYDAEDTTENTGFAMVFDDEQAVLESGDSEQFGQVYDEEEAERIIEDEDGMRVVSYRDFKEENSGIWGRIKGFIF